MSDSPAPVPEEQPPAEQPADDCSDRARETAPGTESGSRSAAAGAGVSVVHPTVAVVNRVLADLASLTGASLWALSDAEALGVLDGMDTALRLAHAVQLAAVREVDGRNVAANEGAPSTAAYLRGMLKMRPRDAHQAVGLAADLDSTYTATGGQLAVARINVDQAGAIVRALNRLPAGTPAEAVGTAEKILLEAAENLDAADLARLGETLRVTVLDALHPDGQNGQDDGDDARRRELTLSDEADGTTRIRGRLDAEAAAALRSAIDALSKPRPTVAGDPDLRTAAQRRADALVEITTRVLTSGTLPLTGGVRPQITVSVTVEALAGRPGAAPAQTGWGLPLPYATLARLCCDPSIARVILNADGVPLDLGMTERLVTPELRRALVARDKGCVFPSCDRPAEWCEAHHLRHWKDGGATALDNLALVCRFHHGMVHHHGWTIRIGADRRPEFIPPAYLDAQQRPRRNLLRKAYPDLLDGLLPTYPGPTDRTAADTGGTVPGATPPPGRRRPNHASDAPEEAGRTVPPGRQPADNPATARGPAPARSAGSPERQPAGNRTADDGQPCERPQGIEPACDRPAADQPASDRPAGDRPTDARPASDRPADDRPAGARPASDRPAGDRPTGHRPVDDRPVDDRPVDDRPAGTDRRSSPPGPAPRNDHPSEAGRALGSVPRPRPGNGLPAQNANAPDPPDGGPTGPTDSG
jgi:hypothetical protein